MRGPAPSGASERFFAREHAKHHVARPIGVVKYGLRGNSDVRCRVVVECGAHQVTRMARSRPGAPPTRLPSRAPRVDWAVLKSPRVAGEWPDEPAPPGSARRCRAAQLYANGFRFLPGRCDQASWMRVIACLATKLFCRMLSGRRFDAHDHINVR